MIYQALKFLADENVSPRLVAFLRERGHDVHDVIEQGWQGKSDAFLLRKAWKAQRFIITHDRDFGKLAIDQHEPCYGVFYLRLRDQRALNAIAAMNRFLSTKTPIQSGTLIVIQESKARIRLTPYSG